MHIIPVIDLKDGIVVSAQQGQRESYQPITSKLCTSSDIEDVINGFLSLHPFKTIYIADLNAITNTGNNHALIDKVLNKNPQIDFWVDKGTKIQQLSKIYAANYKLIIASESQNITNFRDNNLQIKNHILSLDFFPNQGYTGPTELLKSPELWPQDVIIMTLDRVGKNTGPDIARLKDFCQKHPEKNFIAAGGVRNEMDLLTLKETGVNYALIASALHSGIINTQAIKKLISIAP